MQIIDGSIFCSTRAITPLNLKGGAALDMDCQSLLIEAAIVFRSSGNCFTFFDLDIESKRIGILKALYFGIFPEPVIPAIPYGIFTFQCARPECFILFYIAPIILSSE